MILPFYGSQKRYIDIESKKSALAKHKGRKTVIKAFGYARTAALRGAKRFYCYKGRRRKRSDNPYDNISISWQYNVRSEENEKITGKTGAGTCRTDRKGE